MFRADLTEVGSLPLGLPRGLPYWSTTGGDHESRSPRAAAVVAAAITVAIANSGSPLASRRTLGGDCGDD